MAKRKFRRKCNTISNILLAISTNLDATVLSTENPKIPVYIPGIARAKQLFQEIFQKQ